jgi:hypothetical protein
MREEKMEKKVRKNEREDGEKSEKERKRRWREKKERDRNTKKQLLSGFKFLALTSFQEIVLNRKRKLSGSSHPTPKTGSFRLRSRTSSTFWSHSYKTFLSVIYKLSQ